MTTEKILDFLNMNLKGPLEKGFMKMAYWIDFCCTFAIIGGGLLLEVFQKTLFDSVFVVIAIFSIIPFALWLKFAKNPAQNYVFCFYIEVVTFLKLSIGSLIISRFENETFGIWHIIITTFFVVLALVSIIRKQSVLRFLQTHSIAEKDDMVAKKSKGIGYIVLPISATASVGFGLSRVISRHFDGGMGFALWVLASIWLLLVIVSAYNYMFLTKYKVAQIFKEH